MKAAVVVDDWKLPIFRRRLKEARFEYKEVGPLTDGTTLLSVETDNMLGLKDVLEEAQTEASRSKLQ